MKNVVIIGAGPAGLTAAYELLTKDPDDHQITILEETGDIGGISKTVLYKDNRMDMGGHRFFSKIPEVNEWWEKMLPMQGAPAYDYKKLGTDIRLSKNGPDPEKSDDVMLRRNRVSRILFMGKFFDYPISLKAETIRTMGFITTMQVGLSYLWAVIHKLPEDNLENFYVNRFGRKLYSMFFEYYTANLWGRHPRDIDASWGAQRAKGLSIKAILADMFGKVFHKKNRKVETSLIEEFLYPKLGPGQLWSKTASEIEKLGGRIMMETKAIGIETDSGKVKAVLFEKQDGSRDRMPCDIVISSMPLKDLACGMDCVPEDVKRVAAGLPYRDYMTVGVLIPREKFRLKNKTDIRTIGDIIPDNWIYVQDRNVMLGRIQIYNNWSPYMVKDIERNLWLGLEYFVNEGDKYWKMSDDDFTAFAVKELKKLGMISDVSDVKDSHVERIKKAYPAYFDTYDEIDKVTDWIKTVEGLYCVGRNGQHRYNNMDHSMCTSFEAVKDILSGTRDTSNIWSVNTEKEYHETSAT